SLKTTWRVTICRCLTTNEKRWLKPAGLSVASRTNSTREIWFVAWFMAGCATGLSLKTAGNENSDPASKRDRNTQEGCRNGGGILARALVLAGKQLFQLSLQVSRSAVLFCGFECIHGRPVV